jgi:transposase
MDLKSKLYLAFGMSLKSEKEAFDKSMEMLKHIGVKIDSVRLDKYYSFLSYVDRFGKAKVYVIPRKKCYNEGFLEMKRYDGRVCK